MELQNAVVLITGGTKGIGAATALALAEQGADIAVAARNPGAAATALAREVAGANIRVNCVAPGVIRTDFHAQMPAEVRKNNLENRIPLRREGTAAQVAHLVRELVTNDYITGETVSIDGGLTMRIC